VSCAVLTTTNMASRRLLAEPAVDLAVGECWCAPDFVGLVVDEGIPVQIERVVSDEAPAPRVREDLNVTWSCRTG
jgi:hypothetical protein